MKIVQTSLSDGDHLRLFCQLAQFVDEIFRDFDGVGWVNSNRGINARIFGCDSDGFPAGFHSCADRDYAGNPRSRRSFDDGLKIESKLRKIQMSMGVD
jgi:hypothetical protein